MVLVMVVVRVMVRVMVRVRVECKGFDFFARANSHLMNVLKLVT